MGLQRGAGTTHTVWIVIGTCTTSEGRGWRQGGDSKGGGEEGEIDQREKDEGEEW